MPITNIITSPTKCFSEMIAVVTRFKEVFSLRMLGFIVGSVVKKIMRAVERVLYAVFTCTLALGGSIIGTIAGGIKGQSTESGFLDGAVKGGIAGAIAAIEFIDFASVGEEPLSKVALLNSLLNGKVFMELICPAVARAYLFYINASEMTYGGLSDIYDSRGVKGMTHNFIMKLPFHQFNSNQMMKPYNEPCCSICFRDFEDGELVRTLPKCCHLFHLECIDKWLVQQGSCPICRTYVPDHI